MTLSKKKQRFGVWFAFDSTTEALEGSPPFLYSESNSVFTAFLLPRLQAVYVPYRSWAAEMLMDG